MGRINGIWSLNRCEDKKEERVHVYTGMLALVNGDDFSWVRDDEG